MYARIPLLAAALLAVGLAGCAEAERLARDAVATGTPTAGSGGMVTTSAASWQTNASEYRGRSGTFAFDCPPNPSQQDSRSVWGSNPYTDDSSVCKAGVHAGVISYRSGGRVHIQPRPGQNRYVGSERNGVRTSDYGSWGGSFTVVQ